MLGIIGAMTVEVESLKKLMEDLKILTISGIDFYSGKLCGVDVVVAVSGVGKVNAAVCTQTMILKFDVKAIINVGVAGGLVKDLNVCDIAVAESVVEHDMDTSPLGDPVGFVSGLDLIYMNADEKISSMLYNASNAIDGINVKKGIIASGDQFIGDSEKKQYITDKFNAIAAEMEGASIGHVCTMNKVPFGVLRAISDGADDGAPMTYEEFTVKAVKNSVSIILEFLKSWK